MGDLDSENPTAVPFLVDEAAAAPWFVITVVGWVMMLAGTVVAGIVLIGVVFPEITVSTTDASSVIGMALPTPVPVH